MTDFYDLDRRRLVPLKQIDVMISVKNEARFKISGPLKGANHSGVYAGDFCVL